MKTKFPQSIRTLALIFLAPALSFSFAHAENAKKPRIALIMKSLANEFFQTMEKGGRDYQAKNPDQFDLISNGIKNETDVSKQIDLVEQMINEKVDAIVIAPADSKALIPVCKKAQQAKILVVNIDNKFDADALAQEKVKVPFVGPDNRKGAKEVGDYLGKKLQEGAKVAILEGLPGAFNGIQRKLGFEDAAKDYKLDVVSSQSADWETSKANQVASGIITQHPEIVALMCANDSMALGAVSALRSAGKEDKVQVVGFDNISAVQQLIKEGKVLATADQHADQLAAFGIQYALDGLKNKELPTQDQETKVDLITAENLK